MSDSLALSSENAAAGGVGAAAVAVEGALETLPASTTGLPTPSSVSTTKPIAGMLMEVGGTAAAEGSVDGGGCWVEGTSDVEEASSDC